MRVRDAGGPQSNVPGNEDQLPGAIERIGIDCWIRIFVKIQSSDCTGDNEAGTKDLHEAFPHEFLSVQVNMVGIDRLWN